jgi:hypothetical protein
MYLSTRLNFKLYLWRTKLLVFHEHSKCSSFYLEIINIKNRFSTEFILPFFVFLHLDLANDDKSRDRQASRACC